MRCFALLLLFPAFARAADPTPIEALLKAPIIGPRAALIETEEFLDAKVPRLSVPDTAAAWQAEAQRLREKVLKEVVFRGAAAKWRDAKTGVEFQETIKGDGYSIRKLRYEILPGFWIPALLYEPEKLEGKIPVSLSVNGHDALGKAAQYKQTRCINMAKRGMLVLNVEWLGMGQLRTPGNAHVSMNQLDLCGSSGVAPYFLSMSRGLDLLLNHSHADPKRVAVNGLSGGGWQTIFISSLDPRVTLTNPVAGYSSFRTRIGHHKDLGDSEQTPCDLATVADYAHLTAMMAPRPTLLTFNAKDDCCFEAGYALPLLYDGTRPVFKLLNAENALRSHVNEVPGNHNFGKDNREALYKMLGDFFFAGDKNFKTEEIPCEKELKTKDELAVTLPEKNLDMNALALALAKDLPRQPSLPSEKAGVEAWRTERLAALKRIVRPIEIKASKAMERGTEKKEDISASYWTLNLNKQWTVPIVELSRPKANGTAIVIADAGREAAKDKVKDLLDAGRRVVVADLWYFGEAKPNPKDWLWGLMLATVGERPLGLQAAELNAVAIWANETTTKGPPATVYALGPRSSTIALIAAALSTKEIGALELTEPLGSFKEIIEANRSVASTPELFCFGLLEELDIKQIAALIAPRPVRIRKPSERAANEFAGLGDFYKVLGVGFDPLK
jgi:hypothetical protein